METDALERFLRYVTYDTQSNKDATDTPSTKGQFELARILEQELLQLGLSKITLDKHCYLYGLLPANTNKTDISIGFIAHLDTSPAVSGKDVKPRIITNPEGEQIIVSDGTTLLGADDKAGIAAIVSAMAYLQAHPEILHGNIYVAFTPDEEIGRGTEFFNTDIFKADWAYTVDGGELGELEFENFNAAKAVLTINGKNVHPGYAKGIMKNSMLIAGKVIEELSKEDIPENTEGRKGFYHLDFINGSVEQTVLHYIIRDFDIEEFDRKKKFLQYLEHSINEQFGEGCASLVITDQYSNMGEIIKQHPHIIQIAQKAMEEIGVTPKITAIRGGTDGARLSFMGLPCPNLFAGGMLFHSKDEYLPVKSLQKACETIIAIIKNTAEYNKKCIS